MATEKDLQDEKLDELEREAELRARRGVDEEREEDLSAADEPESDSGDVAEHPGSTSVSHERGDELADEWGEELFPSSDPPAHY